MRGPLQLGPVLRLKGVGVCDEGASTARARHLLVCVSARVRTCVRVCVTAVSCVANMPMM